MVQHLIRIPTSDSSTLYNTWIIVSNAILPAIQLVYTHTLGALLQIKGSALAVFVHWNYVTMVYRYMWPSFLHTDTNTRANNLAFDW
jgi:hypothetical protein